MKVNNTIPGRYYGSSTDAAVVIELDNSGGAKRYNRHMGGDFEWTGEWNIERDSIQLVFSKLNTIFENEEVINDTSMWAINNEDGTLSFFKKIGNEQDEKDMTDKFIEKTKQSVRKYDEDEKRD